MRTKGTKRDGDQKKMKEKVKVSDSGEREREKERESWCIFINDSTLKGTNSTTNSNIIYHHPCQQQLQQ